jgi:hypothetical protein
MYQWKKSHVSFYPRAVDSVKERSCENLKFTKVRTDKKYYGARTVIHCAGIHLVEGKSVKEFLIGWFWP